jgi:hypothetical protein
MKKISAYVLIGALLATTALGALVVYLSNTTYHVMNVNSPLELASSKDGGSSWLGTIVTDPAYGGETVFWSTRAVNRANATISATLRTTVSNLPANVDCADFTQVQIEDVGVWTDITAACVDNGDVIVFDIPATYLALETEAYNVSVTLNAYITPTQYVIATQAV